MSSSDADHKRHDRLDSILVAFFVCALCAPWVPLAARGLESRPRSVPPLALSIVNTAALAALLVASLTHVAARTYNPFIYFRF